jgi:glycosyltransferase involved in cell wall biosynthesis
MLLRKLLYLQSLIKMINNSICHITIFPKKNMVHSPKSGVASYSRIIVDSLADLKIPQVILCDIENIPEEYEENNYLVRRCFNCSINGMFSMLKSAIKESSKIFHIQQEVFLYGGLVTAYLLAINVTILRLCRRKIIVTVHGVVDLNSINISFIRRNNSSFPPFIVRQGLLILFKILCHSANVIIVHEDVFAKRLEAEYGVTEDKIHVIPHILQKLQKIEKHVARKKLNLPVNTTIFLFIGYLTGYKGIDLLLEGVAAFFAKGGNGFLIIGAGLHPKHANSQEYIKEYQSYQKKALALLGDRARWVGFIPEEELACYYGAADATLFPYLDFLGSSGPMTLSIAYDRPFLASNILQNAVIPYPDIFFSTSPEALADSLIKFSQSPEKFSNIISILREQRLPEVVCQKFKEIYKQMRKKL